MAKHPTVLDYFRSFYFQNKPQDLVQALEYFGVFGGTGWSVDMQKTLWELIETKALKNYTYIHNDIAAQTHSSKISHTLLTAIATGDRRIFSTFKRARISREEGEEALYRLYESGLIEPQYSLERPLHVDDDISDKLSFIQPFMRFWFAFISPFYKSIKEGNYEEVKTSFQNREQGFFDPIFTELAYEVLKKNFVDDPIVEIGSYWDKKAQIDILAKTHSGKRIAGTCKYSDAKVKKSELSKLIQNCTLVDLEADVYVIFSKNGFSNELKSLKNESLKLYTIKSFKTLIDDVSDKDFIPCEGKRY